MGFFDDVMGGLKDTLREDLSTFMESVIISPYKWGRKLWYFQEVWQILLHVSKQEIM